MALALVGLKRKGPFSMPAGDRSGKDYQYRTWPTPEIRVSGEDGDREITWYAAKFDTLSEDLGNFRERISRRAFSKTLQEHDIRALFNHNADYVLGRNRSDTLDLTVDLYGLRATVKPPDTQWARDLFVSIERKDISGGSFAFDIIKDRWTSSEEGEVIRELQEVRLYDVSLVTYPAYPATEGVNLRSIFAGLNIVIDDLTRPLLLARAGLPLATEERARFCSVIASLQGSLPEPRIEHSAAVALRSRKLRLLELKEV